MEIQFTVFSFGYKGTGFRRIISSDHLRFYERTTCKCYCWYYTIFVNFLGLFWKTDILVALTVSFTLFLTVILAKVVGGTLLCS